MKHISLFVLVLITSSLVSCSIAHGERHAGVALKRSDVISYPDTFRIEGLTRISHSHAYCISTCIQMIGEWAGKKEPIEYYNWLTGFSYGGFYKDRFVTFMPISDAMKGLTFGVRYLGLKRVLYGTKDPDLLVAAIKSRLARGFPVMIMYDYNVHTGKDFFFPHAALITGYTKTDFLYFEPSFSDTYVANATKFDSAPIATFLSGIEWFHKNYGLSKGYHFMVFEKAAEETDMGAIWTRNGEESKGIDVPFTNISTGSRACIALAKEIENTDLPDWGWKKVLPVWIAFGEYSRLDNARFVEERFGNDGAHRPHLIELLRQIAADYRKILAIINDSGATARDYKAKIPPLLREIAAKENEAGERMLRLGSER